MKISFLEIAQIELDEAIEYYNYEVPSLGDSFLTEVLNTLDRICEFPEACHPFSKRTRRCQTRRFPYGIILPNTGTRNPGCGSCASSQKTRLLAGSNINLPNISLEKDAHSAALHSHLSSWLCGF